jgi:hypothetical protein
VLNAYVLGYGLFGNQTSRKYRPKGIFLKANLPLGLDTTRDERPNLLLYNVSLIPPTGVSRSVANKSAPHSPNGAERNRFLGS